MKYKILTDDTPSRQPAGCLLWLKLHRANVGRLDDFTLKNGKANGLDNDGDFPRATHHGEPRETSTVTNQPPRSTRSNQAVAMCEIRQILFVSHQTSETEMESLSRIQRGHEPINESTSWVDSQPPTLIDEEKGCRPYLSKTPPHQWRTIRCRL
eukprot:scaffold35357_cov73-Cyclotella_meneghiniana.AAC.4